MMFTTFFKMTDHPFAEHAPLQALRLDERFRQGQARLHYLFQHAHLALITGEQGVGKSSLLRLFIDSLKNQYVQPLYLHLTHLTHIAFLRLLARALGELPAQHKDQIWLQIIDKINALNTATLLIIDDAHLLDPRAFIDLRLLLSTPFDNAPPLKLVLVGHSELKTQMKRSMHTALAQQVNVAYDIPPLSAPQTHQYLDFQMRRVASHDKVFETEVKQLIHEQTRGIPRLINNLATACLINAASQNSQKVHSAIFRQTLHEFPLYT